MTISMYQASVPMLIRMLTNLKGILEKGAAYAQAKKIEEAALLNARLYPDMFVLTRQVQVACDLAPAPARVSPARSRRLSRTRSRPSPNSCRASNVPSPTCVH